MTPPIQDDLDTVFKKLSAGEDQLTNLYNDFFLLANPFPGVGQFIPGISIGQEKIKQEFARQLEELYTDRRSRRMVITGQTGAGKTNVLRDFERRILNARAPRSESPGLQSLHYAFLNQPQSSYIEIHRQLISQLGALFYNDLYEAERQHKVDFSRLAADLPGLNPELVTALARMSPSRQSAQLSFFGPNLQALRALDQWLQGIKLSQPEKKLLGGVTADVGKSSTVAIKLLGDLIRIFRHASLFKGLVILFDEFEQILATGSRTDQARYAQDLRNLFDTLTDGVLFVIATAPISSDLMQLSPALNRRLEKPLPIEPIRNSEEALQYAQVYIETGRREFEQKTHRPPKLPKNCPKEDRPYFPLRRSSILEIFEELRKQRPDVIPGDFLPELNLRIYQLVYEGRSQ